MANYTTADFNIFQTTAIDYVDDSKLYKSQLDLFNTSLDLGHSVNASNPVVSVINVSADDISIFNSTRPAWLIGRRPQTGQLYPRGVYNK